MNIILWDIDGTLVRSGADAGNLYHEAVELAAEQVIPDRLPNTHGKTDHQIIGETLAAHGFDQSLHAEALLHLDELSRLRHEAGNHRELCPGAAEAIRATAAAGWTNGLLTGNSAARSRFKLTGAGLDATMFDWEHSYFGNTSPLRSALTVRARAELGDRPVVIVGDTPNDGRAADFAGFSFLAVATGAFTADELRETSARVVVEDLVSGLDELLAFLAQTIGPASAIS